MTATAKLWAKRVAAWRASGKTSIEFVEGQGFSAGGLRFWAHKLKEEAPAREKAETAHAVEPVRVLRVVRRKGRAESAPSAPARDADSRVTLQVGAVRVSIGTGFDRETLRGVLDVLGAGAEVSR